MRKTLLPALAALLLAAGPSLAADGNYNDGAAGNATSDTANCRSALMRDACAAALTEAPLPLAGAGLVGLLLMGGAGASALILRRRRRADPLA
ncbi:hypothetical protein E2C06_34925 [Dankookia rubra]|uniref:VPEID-CTERM sorting domain-containing protein n=1 Tax=Dankookia rubra TaxID=1442381 RepID=A0A4R5Q7E3_9PROT|nr:hypothetical protein [Dankookia rubra]TDH57997.1 hypothetical protein E2C06_34925 [Dankookia rubra]